MLWRGIELRRLLKLEFCSHGILRAIVSTPIKDTTTLMPEVQIHEWSFRLGAFPKIPFVRQKGFLLMDRTLKCRIAC